jgi:hypothetical protein
VPEVLGLCGVSFKLYSTCGTSFYFVDTDHKVYPGTNGIACGHLATMTEATQGEAELGITNLTYRTDNQGGSGTNTYTLIWREDTNGVCLWIDRYCAGGAGTTTYNGSLDLYRGKIVNWQLWATDGSNTTVSTTFLADEGRIEWQATVDDAGEPGFYGGYFNLWFQWVQTIPPVDIVQEHEYMLVSVSSGDDSEDFKAVVTPAGSHLHI